MLNLLGALVCAGMLGYAIYSEKVLGYVPCPLCMFQRVCIGALGLVFLVAALHPARRAGSIVYAVLVFLAAGATTWIGAKQEPSLTLTKLSPALESRRVRTQPRAVTSPPTGSLPVSACSTLTVVIRAV